MQIPIHHIRTDGGTQPRLHLDLATVAEYVEAMSDGATFPPVTVFYDGANYWLADGFHRTSAAQQLGIAEITADVRQGTLQDAQWHSYSVNQAHGLRRTNEDKRRAVEAALSHPFHAKYSNREIARHIGVTPEYISRMATSIDRSIDRSDTRIVTRNGTTYEMNTANIGARPNFTTPFVPTATDYADFYGDDEPELWERGVNDGDRLATISALTPRPANHQLLNQSTSNEWYTPREYTDAARELMGAIDTDPASNDQANAWIGAATYYTKETNGFDKPWHGRVWMNPPYGKEDGDSNQSRWTTRLIEQWQAGTTTEAICLVNAVPGNLWFAPLWRFPICFVARRIRFYNPEGELGDPTHSNVLVYLPNRAQRVQQITRFVHLFSLFGPVAAKLVEHDGQIGIHGMEL